MLAIPTETPDLFADLYLSLNKHFIYTLFVSQANYCKSMQMFKFILIFLSLCVYCSKIPNILI